MFRLCPLLFWMLLGLLLASLMENGHGSSSVKPRNKRSYNYGHSKDLALVLAKNYLLKMIINEQHDLDKAKENVYTLQKDSCTHIKSIGKPVTHNARSYTQGTWMKDPLGIMGAETIFVMEGYSGRNVLEEFENLGMFKAGIARKKYILPYNWDGTGGVVYGPYLYYNRAATNNIVKYNLRTERLEKQIGLAGSARNTHYQWGGDTQVDLAVDEQGLWALWGYSGNSNKLRARMIDVFYGNTLQSWNLNTETMSSMGNAFVACGVIYCIDSYNYKSTTINFAYDTKTGSTWNPNIQFTNQFGYNSMVAYNPRERVLYAWDNQRLVTYPISFKEH